MRGALGERRPPGLADLALTSDLTLACSLCSTSDEGKTDNTTTLVSDDDDHVHFCMQLQRRQVNSTNTNVHTHCLCPNSGH